MLINTSNIGFSASAKTRLSSLGLTDITFEDLLVAFAEVYLKPEISTETIDPSDAAANARTFGLGGGGTLAAQLTSRNIGYTVTDSTLSFDYKPIINSLPSGITYVSSTVNVVGNTGKKVTQKGNAGTVKLPEQASQASFTLNLQTALGGLTMEKTVPIVANGAGNAVLDVKDLTTAPSTLKIKDNLEMLNAAVALLQSKG